MKHWPNRRLVLEAIVLLPLARLLVRFVKIGRWKHTLEGPSPYKTATDECPDGLALGTRIGRSVERADWRMGSGAKCLPKAMVALWMLQRRAVPARLVIASTFKSQHGKADPLHAWAEVKSTMIIGHCDRSLYQPLAEFGQGAGSSVRSESLAREAF